ncbi:17132_t:CDS:2, partial [Rhizophagus irregularis]
GAFTEYIYIKTVHLASRFNSNQNTSIQQKDEIRNLAYTSLDIALLEW